MQQIDPTGEGSCPGEEALSDHAHEVVSVGLADVVTSTGARIPPVDRGPPEVVVQTTGPAMVGEQPASRISRNGTASEQSRIAMPLSAN